MQVHLHVWDRDLESRFQDQLGWGSGPTSNLPAVKASLDIITSRAHYKQLCKLRPDLCKLDFIQQFYNDRFLWKFSLNEIDDDSSHGDDLAGDYLTYQYFKNIEKLLINIPLRHGWLDELPNWLLNENLKLFTLAACIGHSALVQSLLQRMPVDEPKLAEAATISLSYAAGAGYSEIIERLLKVEGIDPGYDENVALIKVVQLLLAVDGIDPEVEVEYALKAAAVGGHVDLVRWAPREFKGLELPDDVALETFVFEHIRPEVHEWV
ncbi:hypothetical protein HDU76_003300 [Blyttiomyces sp. JEL0837]|nr:hypothetical protein HDU76_003300 [Blyttiomyces sp. JEL0837]